MRTDWKELTAAYVDMVQAADSDKDVALAWSRYRERVIASSSAPPYHLATLLEMLGRVDKRRADIRILEHGFGSGSALLYLLAIGYTGIRGIDLGGPAAALNRISAAAGLTTPPFAIYDGLKLPYADASFDFVFSQQVLEHVAPSAIDSYYSEEARVLVTGGIAYHQVPHRLVPYDSHTRTWFVHYLPLPVAQRLYRLLGRDSAVTREHLFLRLPGYHRRQMRRRFGHCLDVTDSRLRRLRIEAYYDGPAGLRRFLGKLVNAPLVGSVAAAAMRNLVMIDTLSVKREPQPTSGSE